MRIAIDLTPLFERKITGVEIYGIDLYKALMKTGNTIIPIFHGRNTLDDNPNAFVIPKSNRLLLENVRLSMAVRKIKADITLFPIFPPPLDIYYCKNTKIVPTIHDVAFLKFRDTINFAAKYYLTPKYKMAFKKSDAIITISETEKKELERLSPKPVFNCHNIISSDYKDSDKISGEEYLKKWNLEKDGYIISVSTIEPRKNFPYLLKVLKPLLLKENKKLVLVGRKGWDKTSGYDDILKDIIDRVIFTDFVSFPCLVSLYKYASAFALLSLDEGFGRTPYEAVASGCRKVILSDIPIFHETFGDNALYLPLNNEKKCIETLLKEDIPSVGSNFHIPFNDLEEYVPEALNEIIKL